MSVLGFIWNGCKLNGCCFKNVVGFSVVGLVDLIFSYVNDCGVVFFVFMNVLLWRLVFWFWYIGMSCSIGIF